MEMAASRCSCGCLKCPREPGQWFGGILYVRLKDPEWAKWIGLEDDPYIGSPGYRPQHSHNVVGEAKKSFSCSAAYGEVEKVVETEEVESQKDSFLKSLVEKYLNAFKNVIFHDNDYHGRLDPNKSSKAIKQSLEMIRNVDGNKYKCFYAKPSKKSPKKHFVNELAPAPWRAYIENTFAPGFGRKSMISLEKFMELTKVFKQR
ncbi:hypothetical protein HPP92_010119 [Vanilla planifolia]|uniref:Uncharacterized protein n=1 Tax=Vanilla planifolia TaxID=51239 RepID=A0A835V356_VANPL|nr:hypothetical protein HPP92_010119 [Vanilla planifolia]